MSPTAGHSETLREAVPSAPLGLVGFGGSHINVIANTYRQARNSHWAGLDISFFRLRDPAYRPLLTARHGKQGHVNEKLRAEMEQQIREKRPPFLFCSLAGAAHIVIGLVNHQTPFHVLPRCDEAEQSLVLRPRTRVIPYDVVVGMFERKTDSIYALLAAVMEATDLPIYQLCPPPPIGDEEHLRQNPGKLAKEIIEEFGIAPKELRRTLWLAYTQVMRARCRALGAVFVEPPETSFDRDGYLERAYYSTDAVHANTAYGDLVLQQLAAIAES